MLGTAESVFLIVASVCVVIMTLAFLIVCYVVIRVALGARSLITLVHGEVNGFLERRRRMVRGAKFSLIWLEALVRRWTGF